MNSEPIIRYATVEDVPIILQLIQELAIYEHALDSCKATVDSLRATLAFAPLPSPTSRPPPAPAPAVSAKRPARALLLFHPSPGQAPSPDEPAGLALYFHSYSTWRSAPGIYLEDLFVREAYRGRGYGRRLLRELAAEVVRSRGARLEWSVLKWNEPSIGFYQSERVGAQRLEEWVGMRVDGEALLRLAAKEEAGK